MKHLEFLLKICRLLLFKTKNLVNSTLQVLDENDNNPQFVNVPGNFSVRENSPPGQHLNW